MQRLPPILVIACLCLAPAGSTQGETEGPESQPVQFGKNPAKCNVSLKIKSWKQTQSFVASHKGKVVVLDLWSSWCAPCLREFPSLVELHKKHGENVVCISANCNFEGLPGEPPKFHVENVLKFLKEQDARFSNVLFSEESDKIFELAGVGSIPVVFVFGKDGKLAQRFDNEDPKKYGGEEFTYKKHIIPLVQSLLKKPSPGNHVKSSQAK